jgi:aspartyl-tRNA(Asn)/glutamyl-tRNA(Gln) amidotransferase subunit B
MMENPLEFETVIGLETHVQLSTKAKIFAPSAAQFGAEPNENIDPVTLGLPGCLPVLNRAVVEAALMLGIATNCEIRNFSRFARKHYFYPDLPKGYQISQFDEPICERGHLNLLIGETQRTIGIKRIHMEEDAGKNIHEERTHTSLVDLNRAGVRLLEVVSEADLRSPAEAAAYLKALRQLVRFLGISDGDMEKGSLRCDANISLRPVGELKFGIRTEIKNLNSFKFVERALEYEVARQTAVLKSGGRVAQETLTFDSAEGATRPLRGKEESADYRYFPDPDLPPLVIEERWIRDIRERMPKLPDEWRHELVTNYGLSAYDAAVLTTERSSIDYFAAVLAVCSNPRAACNWVTGELFGALNKHNLDVEHSPVTPQALGALIKLIDNDVIHTKIAKSVFEEMLASGKAPDVIVQEKGLQQMTDDGQILKVVQAVLDNHPDLFNEFLAGNDRLRGYFIGLIMKATNGTAHPRKVQDLLAAELRRRQTGG